MQILETNLDDVSGEIIANTIEKLMENGAKDVTVSHAITKKGRPSQLVSVICDPNNTDKLVPCKFIVNSMMKEFEKFLGKAAFPINIAFVKEVRSKELSEQTKNLVHDRIDSTKDQKA